ncbi:hypothetical protein [Sulfolobus polyhedral virus 1]|uniref:Uncharacterized protein n=1 Tax=Sulfolobus polyhedral virus 1 TaxID=1982658 RepID=A0A1W6I168_SPV1|nr:hypothetical protein DT302_gp21 [Sulfolobus polyhedral virus 1]ARM37803.1 hypothetical protein [Sulfolobus polyhedral virus 1]
MSEDDCSFCRSIMENGEEEQIWVLIDLICDNFDEFSSECDKIYSMEAKPIVDINSAIKLIVGKAKLIDNCSSLAQFIFDVVDFG